MIAQRGGFAIGLIVGLLAGLALALGVALYVTKVPVPFVNKVPQRTAEQDAAETERNKNWDPNAPLANKPAVKSGAAPTDHNPLQLPRRPRRRLPPPWRPARPRRWAPAWPPHRLPRRCRPSPPNPAAMRSRISFR